MKGLKRYLSGLLAVASVAAALLPSGAMAAEGTLIKVSCGSKQVPNDPCTAVYYHGRDGRRHAFSNDKVYFSWFSDFSGIQTISASAMAAVPLGTNVTYRPGVKMVKFVSINKVYAVGLGGELRGIANEDVARGLYGNDWNKQIDDISEAFFTDYRTGTDVVAASDFDKTAELAAAANIDGNLDSIRQSVSVLTSRGTFSVELIKLQRNRFSMLTDTGDREDCSNNCAAKSLSDYASSNGATIGIHGSYFCPPDYADCAAKIYTFLGPVYNVPASVMINADDLMIHEGPMIAQTVDGKTHFFHRTKEFGGSAQGFEAVQGSKLNAAASNFPSMVENGAVIVESESRLDDGMKTVKAVRGAIGYDDKFFYLAVIRSATVVDASYVMQTLGAKYAMNLDGGGSAALWYDGAYRFGPGRLLPNAILFKKK